MESETRERVFTDRGHYVTVTEEKVILWDHWEYGGASEGDVPVSYWRAVKVRVSHHLEGGPSFD